MNPSVPHLQSTDDAVSPAPVHVVTEGERKFDRIAYRDIGYIANALISVGAVYWVERMHSGRNWLNQFKESIGKLGVDKETAGFLATKSFFLSGGFAVLLPVKWLEDAKLSLVRQWNREAYGAQADTDSVIRQSEQEIEQGPKQTWSSIFSSRALALVPFYATIGLLWDNKSLLSKLTNPELRAMSKEAIATMEKNDPEQFAKIASKGLYFDNVIAKSSRAIGKGWAKLTGNHAAQANIAEMESRFPGMIKQGETAAERDADHSAVPYYFISEAITSGMVALGVYPLTRITAPFFDRKPHVSPVVKAREENAQTPAPAETPAQPTADVPQTTVARIHEHAKAFVTETQQQVG